MKKILRNFLSFFLVTLIAVSSLSGVAAESAAIKDTTVNVRFTIPSDIAKKKVNYTFSIREKGTATWTNHGLYDIEGGIQVNLKLTPKTDYEYVVNYFDNRTYYKVIGDSLSINSSNELTHETQEASLVTSEYVTNQNESYWNLTQVKHPEINQFDAKSTVFFGVDPDNVQSYFNLFDYDGTLMPLEKEFRYTFYKPLYPNMTDGVDFKYEIKAPGYTEATGTLHYDKGSDGNGSFIDVVGHEAKLMGPFATLTLQRGHESVDVIVPNLINNTTVATATGKDTTTVIFEQDRFNIDLGGEAEDRITMRFTLEGYVPVEVVVDVTADGTVTVVNQTLLETMVKNLTIDANTITFNQLRQSPITQHEDGSGYADFGSLKEMFGHLGSVTPGEIRSHQFRITNPSEYRYRIIGAELIPSIESISANGMYRTGSEVIKSYYEHFNPSYEIKAGSAAYLFDFEAVNGISLYDGILKEYQRTMPELKRLEDLPASEMLKIFTMEDGFNTESWEGDPNADYAVQLSPSRFAIREQDPKMLALGQHHLFNNALYLSFDKEAYPLSPVGENMSRALQFTSYVERTSENTAMLQSIFDEVGIIDGESYIDFDAFGYVLDGNMVPNAYKPTFNAFDFGFKLKLGIVGIDGYAFHDLDRDGYHDDVETVMAGVDLELLANDTVIATTRTSENGYYAFPNVDPGTYQIRVKIPANYAVTTQVNDLLGNRFDASGLTQAFTVTDDGNYHYRVGFVQSEAAVESNVVAKHVLVDQEGTVTMTLDTETITGKVGSNYTLSAKTYPLFEYVRHEGAPASGTFIETDQSMTFIYRTKDAVLKVNYVDRDGYAVAPSTSNVYPLNEAYNVTPLAIEGYTYKELQAGSAPMSGTLSVLKTSVTLVYDKNEGPVISEKVVLEVNYVDEDGAVIAPQKTTSHEINAAYTVTPIEIKGYTYKTVNVSNDPLQGNLTKPTTVVTLIYTKNSTTPEGELPNTGVAASTIGYGILLIGAMSLGAGYIFKRRQQF
ncbi:MucBP domain-containing protein [Erysipelothrix anatis]|uniref:MucBP domain-containing protein n=1 Tax=Erysipelothrix anatis TaxID=2683713 RepID=UPI00135A3836|nr:MucBP domain-containing protein [Erysipelothrix anatis]